ncbi:MAG: hypothetical protein WAZ14_02430 [Patescibacteria group bacterium]
MSIRLLQLGIWCLPVLGFLLLLNHYLVPSGTKVAHYVVGDLSPVVQRLLPDERVSAVMAGSNGAFVHLLDEPVYFSVMPPPGNFEHIQLEVAFDPAETPTFEIGGLKDIAAQAFDFQPLAHALLEDLAWTRYDLSDGLAIFSKDPKSLAYQTFLETPPDRTLVATYRAEFPTPFRDSNYTPLGQVQTFDVSLRGPHELLTYVKSEEFNFSVTYTDVNRTYGADDGFVKVYDESGSLMTEYVLKDDGNIYDNQEPSTLREVQLTGKGWPEGVYRIVLSGTSDLVWRSVQTTARYLVVKNRVFIGDDVGYLAAPRATELYTDAARVTLETQHREGLQTVIAGETRVAVDEVGAKYATTVSGVGVKLIQTPVGDLKITGEGKYAFSRASFFNPDPVPVTPYTSLDDGRIEHVLANLAPVTEENGWRVAEATFDTSTLAFENGAYKFTLSAPGAADSHEQVAVHAIKVTFSREPLTLRQLLSEFKQVIKLLLP